MRFLLYIALIISLLFLPQTVLSTEGPSAIDQLNYLSDEALQLTKSQRYEDAKKILDAISAKLSTYSIMDQMFTMDEVRIVTVAHNEAVEATSNATMNPDERINKVTKFRLAIDAISSTKQPLWAEMQEPIMTVVNDVKEAAFNGESEAFNEKFNSFLTLYDIIYPGMKIDIPIERIQKLDTRVQYIDRYRTEIFAKNNASKELTALETELHTIFEGVTEDEADPSLWWVIISTGSIIIMTLSYVGWRKYKGEREKSKRPSRD